MLNQRIFNSAFEFIHKTSLFFRLCLSHTRSLHVMIFFLCLNFFFLFPLALACRGGQIVYFLFLWLFKPLPRSLSYRLSYHEMSRSFPNPDMITYLILVFHFKPISFIFLWQDHVFRVTVMEMGSRKIKSFENEMTQNLEDFNENWIRNRLKPKIMKSSMKNR